MTSSPPPGAPPPPPGPRPSGPPPFAPPGDATVVRPQAPAGPPSGPPAGGPAGPPTGPPAGGPGAPPPPPPPTGGPPPQPPGGFGPPPGGFGPPPGGPPAPKKSRVGLVIGLVVVLLLVLGGAAAAVVVWAPWDDDSGSERAEDDSDGDDGAEDDPDDGDDDGSDDPSDDASSPTDDAGDGLVTADVTGDGLGDVVASYFHDSAYHRLTLTSTGTSFTADEKKLDFEERAVWDDFDGDGTIDLVAQHVSLSSVEIEDADGNVLGSYDDLGLYEDTAYYVGMTAAEVDGDDLPDLVVWGQTAKDVVTMWVLSNNGDGFDDPAEWATIDNATIASVKVWPGDWDGDGATDLLTTAPVDPLKKGEYDDYVYYGVLGTSLVTSTGSSFEIGAVQENDAQLGDRDATVGDYSGDGTPLLAVNDYYDSNFTVYEYDGTTLVERPELEVEYGSVVKGTIVGLAATDADGDGIDDLAFVTYEFEKEKYEPVHVAISTGADFTSPAEFGEVPACDELCLLSFQMGS